MILKAIAFIPVVRELVDLGFHIADNIRKRQAARAAERKAAKKG